MGTRRANANFEQIEYADGHPGNFSNMRAGLPE
jgi:hypothetical protein